MHAFTEQYTRLNAEQKKAVDTIDGPVFVMAGPGTGKTQILTLRIANLLQKVDGIEPENILALTFTNQAAYNMRERLSKIVGAQYAHRVYISTFHSFAEDMIKRYPSYFERFTRSRLISPVEQIKLLTELADTYGGESFSVFNRRPTTINTISFEISKVKGEALSSSELRKKILKEFDEECESPDMFYKRASGENKKGDIKKHKLKTLEDRKEKSLAFVDIYEAYQDALIQKNFYDYHDLIASVVDEMKNDSYFQAELQEQFQYILVDEHQDTNDGQNAILHGLIDNLVWEGKPNIFVVGDTKQSIFRFAGASQESFTQLFKNLRDVETISLEKNYRSDQKVLSHAHSLIAKSEHHSKEQELEAFFSYDSRFEYREFNNYKTEALWVASDIQKRIQDGEDPQEIAVLFRNNKDITELRTLLEVYGIAFQDFTKKNLLEDVDMKKLFLLLRCVYRHTDDEIVGKTLFIDFFSFDLIGVQKVLKAFYSSRSKNLSLFEMIANTEKMSSLDLKEEELKKYSDFCNTILTLKGKSENLDFISFFSEAIRELGFLSYVMSKKDSATGLAKIETLFDEIKKEQAARSHFGIHEFIEYLNTLNEHNISMNIGNPMNKGVQLMTFHGSKGLEFETVYIIKALKKRSRGSEIHLPLEHFVDGDVEDERRLMYVAMTRAKKNCLMSSYVYNHDGKEQSRSLHIDEVESLSHIDMDTWEQENTELFADFFGESHEHVQSLLDQEYIQERFLKSALSVSALNNYMESPLVYFFRNLVLIPQARSPFLDFGNLMHGTLEKFALKGIQKGKLGSVDELLSSLDEEVKENPSYEEHYEKAKNALVRYAEYRLENEVLPLETEFRVPAVSFESEKGYELRLTGVIDKISRDEDGSIIVWDYKTGRSISDMDKDRKEKLRRQATFYKILLKNSFGGKYNPQKVIFDFLEPSKKTGEFERYEYVITPEDVDEVRGDINSLVNDIFDGTLLQGDLSSDQKNKEYLEFLEIIKGPRTFEQRTLL